MNLVIENQEFRNLEVTGCILLTKFPIDQQLPYFKNKTYFNEIHKVVVRPDDSLWQAQGLKDTIKFCWSIFLRTCSTHPDLAEFEEIFEDDEDIMNAVVANGVFQFLRKCVMESSKFYHEANLILFLPFQYFHNGV